MAAKMTIQTRTQLPVYTAETLAAKNPVLLKGEVVYESDTRKHKVGDGTTAWNSLPYAGGGDTPATIPAANVEQDASHRFVTDTEKMTWNGKASTAVVTQSANGLMSAADKTKLDGVAAGANNYQHPATHPATIIEQDATHRFVTDTEKISWKNKASTAVATQSAAGLMSAADKTKLDGMIPNRHAVLRCLTNSRTVTPGDTDYEIVVDAADVTIKLPANPKTGQVWRIWKVAAGNCYVVSNDENAANSKKIRWVGVSEGYRINFQWDNYGVWRVLFDGATYLFN